MVTLGLCVVLAALVGVGISGGVAAERSAKRLERSVDLVEAYLGLSRSVAIQDAAEEAVGDDVRAQSRRALDQANIGVRRGVRVLERTGGPEDRALGARIAENQQRYATNMRRYFSALDTADAERADTFETLADPPSQALQTLASQGGPKRASDSLREIEALRSTQSNVLRLTLAAVLLGVGVAVALAAVLASLRRRIDDGVQADLQRLEREALIDSLTGVRNHRAFEEDLSRALAGSRRHGTRLSLVMIDLDGLKGINDGGGHQAGDRAIKAVGERLAATARAGDSVYRIGGDEFAVLLPQASAWEAFTYTQRFHRAMANETVAVSASAGVAEAAALATRDEIIEQADVALMEAKGGGRDTVVFVAGMQRQVAIESNEDRRHRGTLASALARAVDAKDPYTNSHSETVSELSALIGSRFGLDSDHIAALRLAGLVHDVGKIGVPDAILQKPAALDAKEYEVIKTHSTLGHKILHGTDLSREAPWVLHHHERIDGYGYPGGLAGDDIPLESRIIHVADAFEAMTSDRPYRRGMPRQDAVAELQRHAGTQFDPACIEALLRGLDLAVPPVAAATYDERP